MTDRTRVAVAREDELPAGGRQVVEANGVEIVLCHTKGRLFAARNLCSHASEKIDGGRMRDGWIACPVHGARFDLETGRAMNPPAILPIAVYEVEVEDGTIYVTV